MSDSEKQDLKEAQRRFEEVIRSLGIENIEDIPENASLPKESKQVWVIR